MTWSDALAPFGLKLAFVPHDIRKLRFYLPELVSADDLWTLSYYCPREEVGEMLRDPRQEDGWLCSSHIVLLHRGVVYDPSKSAPTPVEEHHMRDMPTKRIFRVVPVANRRRL